MTFKVGDRVVCVAPCGPLIQNGVYKIRQSENHQEHIRLQGLEATFHRSRFMLLTEAVSATDPLPIQPNKIVLNEKAKRLPSSPPSFEKSRLWTNIVGDIPPAQRPALFENLLAKWEAGKISLNAHDLDEAFVWRDQPEGQEAWCSLNAFLEYGADASEVPWSKFW
ncbi:hypothetical protein UFOVP249_17 [uncultured Caudovirales phage]|uniref:Uncharacterized protein n=1 Tax=uncultured Caudovirales phage TaxID=2100421 RepID=A0A6J5LFC0_9CAUD|nr:hypothetical protein UFOVP249_17 [uncultured Caudovirales phage]